MKRCFLPEFLTAAISMARKWFRLVHTDGTTTRTISAVAVENQTVLSFTKAVLDSVSRVLPATTVAANLVVFANATAYATKQPLPIDAQIDAYGGSAADALFVVAPPRLPLNRDARTFQQPRVEWTILQHTCPQLVVADHDQFIRLPRCCIDRTGIWSRGEELILFRRPPLLEQWHEMNRCSIQTYARLWIFGPQGAGKSCTALAFALSLDRSQWDVIWLYYVRESATFKCVWLQGSKKRVCVVENPMAMNELAAILNTTSMTRKTIVFLVGYNSSSPATVAAHTTCLHWNDQDPMRHRLVCVCSMLTMENLYHPELCSHIPTHVDASGGEVSYDRRPVKTTMLFQLPSWRLEEYTDAVQNDAFFPSVAIAFPSYEPQSEPAMEATERIKLVREKYCVAGGRARLMFLCSPQDATEALDFALDLAGLGFMVGGIANDRLMARYRSSNSLGGWEYRLVSSYVVRRLAASVGPRLLEEFAKACHVNPSVKDFPLDVWLFTELSFNGVAWSTMEASELEECGHWQRSDISFFDPDERRITIFGSSSWMAPRTWNTGGYDLVFVDQAANLVRFVQVARVERHAFNAKELVTCLNRLVDGCMTAVSTVELYVVVPEAWLPTFELPVSEHDFQTSVVQVASAMRQAASSDPDAELQCTCGGHWRRLHDRNPSGWRRRRASGHQAQGGDYTRLSISQAAGFMQSQSSIPFI